MFERRLVIWIFKGFAVLAMLGFLGVGALLGALWLEHRTEVTLPTPTGPFAVGHATYAWVDDAQTDSLAPFPGTKRELVVWIWYPSVTGQPSAAMDDYVPAAWQRAEEQQYGVLMSKFLTHDLSRVHTHSILNSEISPQQPAYPVVVMRAGSTALTADYSILAEDLASHGYVVVGLDAPYRTAVVVFPDGRVVTKAAQNEPEFVSGRDLDRLADKLLPAWCADIGFVLDQLERLNASDPSGKLTGRLDMAHVGVFGHSFGGAQAAQFCHDDSRCKAGIDVDGALYGSVIHESLHQPFMFLMSEHSNESDADSRQIEANIQSVYDRLPRNERLRIVIRGANHFNFSDGALLKSQFLLRTLRVLGILGIDGHRQLAVTAYCVHSFFDAYLKGASVSRLKIQSPLYPEIQNH